MKRNLGLLSVAALLVMLAVSACGNGGSNGSSNEASNETKTGMESSKPHEPITLTVFGYRGAYSVEDFGKYFTDPVKKKFPYIDLKYDKNPQTPHIQELLTSGDFPDLIIASTRSAADLVEVDVALDLRDMAKKNNLDFSVYEPGGVEVAKLPGTKGEIYSLPLWTNYFVTFYNKDIFDHFGVAYPKDNMTWEEMMTLAKKLTRMDNGVQYKGLWPGSANLLGNTLGLSYFDPNSNNVNLMTDGWARVLDMGKSFYSIEGNDPGKAVLGNVSSNFIKDKNLALWPTYGNSIPELSDPKQNNGVSWDMVSYPSYKESQGISAEADSNLLMVSKVSKHVDDAFQVAKYMTTDQTQQLDLAKRAYLPAIKLKQTRDVFGQQFPLLKDKNLNAIFSVKPRTPHPFNKYEDKVVKVLVPAFVKWIGTNEDRVTMLRRTQEEATKAVEAAMK